MKNGFPNSYTSSGSRATVVNVALGESGAHVTSPVNGTIVQWHVSATGPGQFAIRVLRPSGDHYLGAGTSSKLVSSAGAHTFAANLPIQAGDLVGVDIPDTAIDGTGINGHFMATGSTFATFNPILVADGALTGFEDDNTSQEMLFNAVVQYPDPAPPVAPVTPATPGASGKKCKKKKHKRSAAVAKKKCKKRKH